ncbi:MAG: hypothetical protein IPG34_07015 [Rhodocyclaceae bacterium]|nr:hypothetical protein [Rhodocyclaceae bacterium]
MRKATPVPTGKSMPPKNKLAKQSRSSSKVNAMKSMHRLNHWESFMKTPRHQCHLNTKAGVRRTGAKNRPSLKAQGLISAVFKSSAEKVRAENLAKEPVQRRFTGMEFT